MKSLYAAFALIALGGCASRHTRVSCDGHLQPINAPAAQAKRSDLPGSASAGPTVQPMAKEGSP
jgi:hypothetical protein